MFDKLLKVFVRAIFNGVFGSEFLTYFLVSGVNVKTIIYFYCITRMDIHKYTWYVGDTLIYTQKKYAWKYTQWEIWHVTEKDPY